MRPATEPDFLPDYRGAVRPPFIEASFVVSVISCGLRYRGAVRPPFIEAQRYWITIILLKLLSGGSPPPLH